VSGAEVADVRQRLAAVAAYAESLLQRATQCDAEGFLPYADLQIIGTEIARLIEVPKLSAAGARDAAMLELAFWSRTWAQSVGASELGEYIVAELVSLYLDQGKTEAEFVSSVQRAYLSVKNARELAGADVHPPGG